MSAKRAATQRAKRVALLAAASNAQTQSLSPELVESVIKHLPRSQLASARLVSKQFAAAVDPLIGAVAISLQKSWNKRVAPFVGLQHVTRLDVVFEVKGSAQLKLRQLQHITSQLPKLNTLRFLLGHPEVSVPGAFATSLSSLTSLTRLDIGSGRTLNPFPQGVQLPGLKAASFGFQCDLANIAALAPNLEHLSCNTLNIWDSAALLACTHFGGYDLYITSPGPAQAFAAAFPNLQVVTYMPDVYHRANYLAFTGLSKHQLLAHLPSVRAVRGLSTVVMRGIAAAGPQVLPQLQRLCLHGLDHLDIPSISSMSQLKHVCITFDAHEAAVARASDSKPPALLRALAALPQLQSLVLPAGVLCSQCCPGVQSSLAALTAKSSLKQLVFLEWWDPCGGMFEAGFGCTHPEAIQAGLQSGAAAAAVAAAAAASTQGRQSQQQQLTILHQPQHRHVMVRGLKANPDSAAGVWGVYGPAGEW